jgi:hypothetical protein
MSTVLSKTSAGKPRTLQGLDEYEYEFETHFSEGEAVDRYVQEKEKHPDSLVVLENLSCGHFEVKVFKSEKDKQAFYRRKLTETFADFWKALST